MENPAEYIPDYGWTAGQMPGVVHRELIACGGFGEVHKVRLIYRCFMIGLTGVDGRYFNGINSIDNSY